MTERPLSGSRLVPGTSFASARRRLLAVGSSFRSVPIVVSTTDEDKDLDEDDQGDGDDDHRRRHHRYHHHLLLHQHHHHHHHGQHHRQHSMTSPVTVFTVIFSVTNGFVVFRS